MPDHLPDLATNGFTCIPSVFSTKECEKIVAAAEGLNHLSNGRPFQERYGNVRFFSGQGEPGRQLRSVLWCGLLDENLEALRRDPRILEVLQPLLGDNIRQVTNQLHYKFAESRISFQLHTDSSSRLRDQGREIRNLDSCFYQTAIVTEPMSLENGGIYFLPGSHRWSAETSYAEAAETGRQPDQDFEETMPDGCVPVIAQAGDLIVWHGNAVHGSALSHARSGSRILYVNGYVRASDSLRGYWAWIRGKPVPLPPIDVPVLVYGAPDFAAFELERGQALLAEYRGRDYAA